MLLEEGNRVRTRVVSSQNASWIALCQVGSKDMTLATHGMVDAALLTRQITASRLGFDANTAGLADFH